MLLEQSWHRLLLDHTSIQLCTIRISLVEACPKSLANTLPDQDWLELIHITGGGFPDFGNPHTLVTDTPNTFLSKGFQAWCCEQNFLRLPKYYSTMVLLSTWYGCSMKTLMQVTLSRLEGVIDFTRLLLVMNEACHSSLHCSPVVVPYPIPEAPGYHKTKGMEPTWCIILGWVWADRQK